MSGTQGRTSETTRILNSGMVKEANVISSTTQATRVGPDAFKYLARTQHNPAAAVAGTAQPRLTGKNALPQRAAAAQHAAKNTVAPVAEENVRAAYERGRTEERQVANTTMVQAATMLKNAANAFNRERAALLNEMREQSVALALAMAEKILEREASNPEAVRASLRKCLAQIPTRTALKARLHPEDLKLLEKNRDALNHSGEALPEELVLFPDASVGRGGCILESPHGSVHAVIKEQLAMLGEALRLENEAAAVPAPAPVAPPAPHKPVSAPAQPQRPLSEAILHALPAQNAEAATPVKPGPNAQAPLPAVKQLF